MKKALLFLISIYRWVVRPILPPACRFHPSCSDYAFEAVSRFGALRGAWMAAVRLSKCHPFHKGGFDPVPHAGCHEGSET